MVFVERVTAATALVKDRMGEMMFHKLYVEFAMTIRGGRKSEVEAEAHWKQWEAKVALKDPEIFHDYMGPNNQLRIWVHTSDIMIWRSQYSHEKEITLEGDSKKKATDADVDKYRADLFTNHGTGPSMGFTEVARALTTNGQEAFQEKAGFLDVMDIVPKEAEEEEEEAAGGNEDTPDEEPDSKKLKVWVDRDKVISTTIRTVTTQHEAFKTKAEAQLDRQLKYLEEITEKAEEKFKRDFEGEIKALTVRTEALSLVLKGGCENKVKEFIARFVETTEAPPCENFAKLRLVGAVDALIQEYRKCTQPKQLQDWL